CGALGVQVGKEALASVFTASATAGASGADVSWSQYSAVPHVTDELAKTKNYEALLAYATRISEQTPCVFVFEDLHWADAASTEVIGFSPATLGRRASFSSARIGATS